MQDEHISLRLGRESTVTLIFEGPLTQEAIGRLINHLAMMQETYPPESELKAKESATWTKPLAG